jgi:hypothetical protein
MTLEFFLYEIFARVVALYLLIDGSRALWYGLAERKFSFIEFSWTDLLVNTPPWMADRDTAPFWYWWNILSQVIVLLACLVIVIFGWWVPNK